MNANHLSRRAMDFGRRRRIRLYWHFRFAIAGTESRCARTGRPDFSQRAAAAGRGATGRRWSHGLMPGDAADHRGRYEYRHQNGTERTAGGCRFGLPSRAGGAALRHDLPPLGGDVLQLGGPGVTLRAALTLKRPTSSDLAIRQTYLRGVQPLVSACPFLRHGIHAAHLLVAEPPRECVYTLGQYRPGSCVPFQWNYPYFSPCAAWRCESDK